MLDALEEDYKLRGIYSPQFRAHLKHVLDYFGAWRAVEVTAEAVDKYNCTDVVQMRAAQK